MPFRRSNGKVVFQLRELLFVLDVDLVLVPVNVKSLRKA